MRRRCCRALTAAAGAALALRFGWAAGAAPASAPARALSPFDADTFARLRSEYAGRPFVLAFWATHCAPCIEDMATWRAMRAQHPRIPIVLVATDPLAHADRIRALLARHDPGDVRAAAFASDDEAPIRWAVDRRWRGELPRTYFFDARHAATERTGVVEPAATAAWFARMDGPGR